MLVDHTNKVVASFKEMFYFVSNVVAAMSLLASRKRDFTLDRMVRPIKVIVRNHEMSAKLDRHADPCM